MYFISETDRINHIIKEQAPLSLQEMAQRDIAAFYMSKARRDMLLGERYYKGEQDILKRSRTAIGEGGRVVEINNLPDNRIVNNVYRQLVDQKVNYLLGKPLTLRPADKGLKSIFTRSFFRTLRGLGLDALNCGIGWLYVYINEDGSPGFIPIKPYELIPCWADGSHSRLEYAVRLYDRLCYRGKSEYTATFAEVYTKEGVYTYLMDGGRLKPYEAFKPYNSGWDRVPLIAFRYNPQERPLIKNVKTLQDGLNSLMSDFANAMEEDVRNTILVIKNYDGEDLGQFRKNLSAYGAVKVKTVDGSQGGVETLSINIDGSNYGLIIDMFKRAIIENGRGYDAKDSRLGTSPNQMNLLSMYNDIDIDANGMETEFSAALEQLITLVKGRAAAEATELVFNRSIIMNESEVIDNIVKSAHILPQDILVAKHPWYTGLN